MIQEHSFLAKREFKIMANNLLETQPYIDEMTKEAN
jgi:hypothetical protein